MALTPASAQAQEPKSSLAEIFRSAAPAKPHGGTSFPRSASDSDAHSTGIGFDPATGVQRTVPRDVARNSLSSFSPGQPGIEIAVAAGPTPENRSSSDKTSTPRIGLTPPQPIVDTGEAPWSTIVKLLVRFESSGIHYSYVCSGATTGSYQILTAGHCIYNHDPNGDGNFSDADWASEVWVFAGQTDRVSPIGVADYPYGEAKGIHFRSYMGWTDFADFAHDWGLVTLDRRLGDHVGWMGREFATSTNLHFSGYPAETPFVPEENPFQYAGHDNGNVVSYSPFIIDLRALAYGGHSGGPAWRALGNDRRIHGVNSTSDRMGSFQATRLTLEKLGDITTWSNEDNGIRAPSNRPDLIEYTLDSSSKNLITDGVAPGGEITVEYNVFNAGFATASAVEVDFYASTNANISDFDTYLGSISIGDLSAFTVTRGTAMATVPENVADGAYYVGWIAHALTPEYESESCGSAPCNNIAIITDKRLLVDQDIVCGNGTVDLGEDCDDGNTNDGDCCSSSCTTEPQGAPCTSDGNLCTNDQCSSGSCVHIPNSVGCNDGLFCNGTDRCAAGSCSVHTGNPCAAHEFCSEINNICEPPVATGQLCTLTVRANGSASIGGIQMDLLTSAVASGLSPMDCQAASDRGLWAFNFKNVGRGFTTENIVAGGITAAGIFLTGETTPADLFECRFLPFGSSPLPSDFNLVLVEAADTNANPIDPAVSVSAVSCARCGIPSSGLDEPRASDCLYILRASVDLVPCEACICDTNDSGAIRASDALGCLQRTVDETAELACPTCN